MKKKKKQASWAVYKRQRSDDLPRRCSDKLSHLEDTFQPVELPADCAVNSRHLEFVNCHSGWGWNFGDTVSHFCLHNQPLTHTLLHKPYWFTKLDLGGILAFLCCEFLPWMEETYSGLPRNSVTCHLCACVWRYVGVYVCWCVKGHMYVQMYTYEAIHRRAVNNLRYFFSRVNTF